VTAFIHAETPGSCSMPRTGFCLACRRTLSRSPGVMTWTAIKQKPRGRLASEALLARWLQAPWSREIALGRQSDRRDRTGRKSERNRAGIRSLRGAAAALKTSLCLPRMQRPSVSNPGQDPSRRCGPRGSLFHVCLMSCQVRGHHRRRTRASFSSGLREARPWDSHCRPQEQRFACCLACLLVEIGCSAGNERVAVLAAEPAGEHGQARG
jgi:hypothetical protein